MDQFDPRIRQMAAIDAMGGALASDRAVIDSPVTRQVFTFHVARGAVLAFTTDETSVSPFTLSSAAPDLERELRVLRSQESEKWDGAILRLDKSTGSLKMQFLFGDESDVVDPELTSLVDMAAAIREA